MEYRFDDFAYLHLAFMPFCPPEATLFRRASHLLQAVHSTAVFASAAFHVAFDKEQREEGDDEENVVEQGGDGECTDHD